MRSRLLILLLSLVCTWAQAADYDLVIESGRVMDPETGFDGLRNLGITDGRKIGRAHV